MRACNKMMTARVIKNKLKEQSGVSIVIALFALIVIIVISTLVLHSAYSNVGRVRRNQQAEQNYLTEASAVQLAKDCLSGAGITYTDTVTDGEGSHRHNDNYVYKDNISNRDGIFKDTLQEWFKNNAQDEVSTPLEKYYYLTLKDKTGMDGSVDFYDVIVHVSIGGMAYPADLSMDPTDEWEDDGYADGNGSKTTTDKGSGEVKMTLDFSLMDPENTGESSQNYHMYMTVPFYCTYAKTVVETLETTETTTYSHGKPTTTTSTDTTTETTIVYGFENQSAPEVKKGVSK